LLGRATSGIDEPFLANQENRRCERFHRRDHMFVTEDAGPRLSRRGEIG
jgi:hypothetical protein